MSVIDLGNRNKGSAVFASLIDIYERNNAHHLKTLKRKLSGMKLHAFPTTGRRSHDLYNVEDFYNSIDIDVIKYTEAGGTWSEDQKLHMIGDVFDGCELHMGHLGQHTVLYNEIGKSVTYDTIRNYVTAQYRTILEAMASANIANTSSYSPTVNKSSRDTGSHALAVIGDRTQSKCKDFGNMGHNSTGFPKCPEHKERSKPRHTDATVNFMTDNVKKLIDYCNGHSSDFSSYEQRGR